MGTVAAIALVLVIVAYGIFWLFMLYEIGNRPESVYRAVGESKAIWFLAVLVLQFFGTLAYFFMARDKLRSAEKPELPPPMGP
jgi:Phospholipase_D-nuclease N-terminal